MRLKTFLGFFLVLFALAGCAKRIPVAYNRVEKTNSVKITLLSGKTVEGSVFKVEPHQLHLLRKDRKVRVVAKSSIRTIRRKPPVYDDFGRGISEEEIQSVQTSRNTLIYGLGGGTLSFGISFFLGSLISESMDENGSTALAATAGVGGGLGTILFFRAGKAKDRRVAIEKVRDKRRSIELTKEEEQKAPGSLQQQLEEEKIKQEELRKEREKLLRELGKKKKED